MLESSTCSKSLPLTLAVQEFLSVRTLHISPGYSQSLGRSCCGDTEFGQINVAEVTRPCWQEIEFL